MLTDRPRRRRGGEEGFSLVELMIAVSLLAVVLGTVATASMVNSNGNVRSQAQVRLAASLEQAVERIHLQQPWFGGVPACANVQVTGSCSYAFDVSSTDRYRFSAAVAIRRIGTGNTTFDVSAKSRSK